MNQTKLAFAACATLIVGACLPALAEDMTRTTVTEVTTTNPAATQLAQATTPDLTMAAPGPAIRWREFRGQVTHVNVERQILEMKLKGSGEFIGVPVLPTTVGIYKNDHQYALADVKNGDTVTIRNLALNF